MRSFEWEGSLLYTYDSSGKKGTGWLLAALVLALLYIPNNAYCRDDDDLFILLKKVEKPPVDTVPEYRIYLQNNALYCTGETEAAKNNNTAASLMADGDFVRAARVLEYGIARAPLFFPFRYNLGVCYIYLKDLKTAFLHLTKARLLVPEYSKTYLQIGYVYDRWGKDQEALNYFREAIRKNPKELRALILTGNLYYKRNQVTLAEKFYQQALTIDPRFPDGLLGKAKVHFYREEFFKAMIQIKSINTTGDYDKSLHYYYAESAFKLRDYKTAFEQYRKLLTFRSDRFFLENSESLIRHKMDLSRRFIESMNY